MRFRGFLGAIHKEVTYDGLGMPLCQLINKNTLASTDLPHPGFPVIQSKAGTVRIAGSDLGWWDTLKRDAIFILFYLDNKPAAHH